MHRWCIVVARAICQCTISICWLWTTYKVANLIHTGCHFPVSIFLYLYIKTFLPEKWRSKCSLGIEDNNYSSFAGGILAIYAGYKTRLNSPWSLILLFMMHHTFSNFRRQIWTAAGHWSKHTRSVSKEPTCCSITEWGLAFTSWNIHWPTRQHLSVGRDIASTSMVPLNKCRSYTL